MLTHHPIIRLQMIVLWEQAAISQWKIMWLLWMILNCAFKLKPSDNENVS